jgi:hypothetical protein
LDGVLGGSSVPYRKEGMMPSSTATITAEQRRAIREVVCLRLIGVGDLSQAILDKDFVTAERLGLECAEDLRLMDDLGWPEDDERAAVELTLPDEDLTEALRRLRDDAQALVSESPEERRASEEEEEVKACHRLAISACEELITDLDPRKGEAG